MTPKLLFFFFFNFYKFLLVENFNHIQSKQNGIMNLYIHHPISTIIIILLFVNITSQCLPLALLLLYFYKFGEVGFNTLKYTSLHSSSLLFYRL